MNKRRAVGVVSTTAGILGLILAVVPFNCAWASDFCGESFHGPGTFTLDSDVGPCSGPNPAIEVAGDGATLNMAGHTVTCDGNSLSIGVLVLGNNQRVSGGTATNCGSGFASLADGNHFTNNIATENIAGFVIEGSKSKLKRNQATANNLSGFNISGDSNTLTGNTAANNGGIGFQVGGFTHVLMKNTANQNGADGFDITGDSHILTSNTATNNSTNGLHIEGDHNQLTLNTATGNKGSGIFVPGDSNTLKFNNASGNILDGIGIFDGHVGNHVLQNKAKGNGVSFFDLEDGNEECTSNKWKRNRFVTKDPVCIR
jgi:parallel beta helix pectate lyase-like protein